MHNFEYTPELSAEVVSMITKLHEYKGRQKLLFNAHQDEIRTLANVAKIQSVGASNRIEGIFTSDKRLREIAEEKSAPMNRSEQEIAGYREVLKIIHENYDFIDVTPNMILQLHRDLYAYAPGGGCFKNSDNFIAETNQEGRQITRFVPVPAFQTDIFINDLCRKFSEAVAENKFDPLLLIPMFVLDFLCIHPFSDGNGRMSRLLTLLLLYKFGYTVGKFISVEMLIEQSKDTYYEALRSSSVGWHKNNNNYGPFIKYTLGILLKAYKEFEKRVHHISIKNKSARIKALVRESLTPITKKRIMEHCPDISKVTVERTLAELVKSGEIRKVGAGRLTAYISALQPFIDSTNRDLDIPRTK